MSPGPSGVAGTAPVTSVAFYLPAFHRIPENDEWWGEGFTEWDHIRTPRRLVPGHRIPLPVSPLGWYDTLHPGVIDDQTAVAEAYGVGAFCYYHYWLHGRRLLERPLEQRLARAEPGHPFCLAWANHPWNRSWDGADHEVLIAQTYSDEDLLDHSRLLAQVFSDARYLRHEGRPVFLVYRASHLPEPARYMDLLRHEVTRLGVPDPYLLRIESYWEQTQDPVALGFDAAVDFQPHFDDLPAPLRWSTWLTRLLRGRRVGSHRYFAYDDLVAHALARPDPAYRRWPCVTPSWDNSPRRRRGASVFLGATPERFGEWVRASVAALPPGPGPRYLFVNAWNEWGEGAVLEPSTLWGTRMLEAHRDALTSTGAWAPAGSR
jgi:lipopolysaccharide biosynthesis protein